MGRIVRYAVATTLRQEEICKPEWPLVDMKKRLVVIQDRKYPRNKEGNDQKVPLLNLTGYDALQQRIVTRGYGRIRRDCLDHVVVVGERHLRHLLRSYATYYNQARTHLSVNKDAPSPRTIHAVGRIVQTPFLGGLHHLYVRV